MAKFAIGAYGYNRTKLLNTSLGHGVNTGTVTASLLPQTEGQGVAADRGCVGNLVSIIIAASAANARGVRRSRGRRDYTDIGRNQTCGRGIGSCQNSRSACVPIGWVRALVIEEELKRGGKLPDIGQALGIPGFLPSRVQSQQNYRGQKTNNGNNH